MCLILFAYDYHPNYLLILAANRDEYYARPALPAHFWEERPDVLAGKDLEQSGTWLGMTRHGRFAAITNYRDPSSTKANARSRGLLVKDCLCSAGSPADYLSSVHKRRQEYNGFNLLLLGGASMWYYSNRTRHIESVQPGIHGLSNHLLDTPWPKVIGGIEALRQGIGSDDKVLVDKLFELCSDRQQAKDEELPNTGVPLEWERLLSPAFIQSEDYGTRATTVLLIDRRGHVQFCERSFGSGGKRLGSDVIYEFDLM